VSEPRGVDAFDHATGAAEGEGPYSAFPWPPGLPPQRCTWRLWRLQRLLRAIDDDLLPARLAGDIVGEFVSPAKMRISEDGEIGLRAVPAPDDTPQSIRFVYNPDRFSMGSAARHAPYE
jgi:hypothetical protein